MGEGEGEGCSPAPDVSFRPSCTAGEFNVLVGGAGAAAGGWLAAVLGRGLGVAGAVCPAGVWPGDGSAAPCVVSAGAGALGAGLCTSMVGRF